MNVDGTHSDRRQRITAVMLLASVVAGFLALTARLCYINAAMGHDLAQRAAQQQQGQREIPARRGLIFDTRGRIVAGSRQAYSVYADPMLVLGEVEKAGTSLSDVARTLAPLLLVDAGLLENEIRTGSSSLSPHFRWLKRFVPDVEAEAVRGAHVAGVGLRAEMQRTYPLGTRMSQVLGVVGIDGNGLEGIEQSYDVHLRGIPGAYNALYNANVHRRVIAGMRDGSIEPQNGGHLVLTIDTVIQGFVEEQLARQVEEFDAESGIALVMDPQSGEVLAMANWPTFDPNRWSASPVEVRRNRAVTDPVEPGSTFKPVVASGALQCGAVSRTESIDCHNGKYEVPGHRRTLEDTHAMGVVPFADVIVYSSNIGMGIIGERVGNERLHEIVRRFGFGEKTGIGFPLEDAGIVRPLKEWSSLSATSVPMGYEIAVTPLQLATAYCAIVNGGLLLRPRLVRSLLSPEGVPRESYNTPIVVRRVLPEEIAHYMGQEVLASVVREGTGKPAALKEYDLAGKTGTTKLGYKDRPGYDPHGYLSSFVGAAPADHPRVVVLVMISRPDPSLGRFGSQVAAPAVKEILFSTLAYLGEPAKGTVQAGL